MERRRLLAAAAAAGGLAVLGWPPTIWAQAAQPPAALDRAALKLVAVFVPAVLGESALPSAPQARQQAIDACAYGVGISVGLRPLHTQQELRRLFAYLGRGPQAIAPSLPTSWDEMSPQAMQTVLENMRLDDQPQGRAAFAALQGLIAGAWYSSALTWASINYPGPLKL